MAHGSGTTWSATLSTSSDGLTKAGMLAYYVVAKDASPAGLTSRTPSGTKSLAVKACNLPPTYLNNDMSSMPVGVTGAPPCPVQSQGEYISVRDLDDAVVSVTFWYQPYTQAGNARWRSLKLNLLNTYGSTSLWNNPLSNSGFPLLPDQGTYYGQWYVQMTDAGGVTGTSAKHPLTEVSCP